MNAADTSLWHRVMDFHGADKCTRAVQAVYANDARRSLREKLQLAVMGEDAPSTTIREAARQCASDRYYEDDRNYGGDWPEDH